MRGIIETSDDGNKGDTETGSGEPDESHESSTELVDADGVEDDGGKTGTADDDGHLERVTVPGKLEEVRSVGAEDGEADKLLEHLQRVRSDLYSNTE